MKAATKPLGRLMRDLFRVEPLEARVLLSADPVLGAAQVVLRPVEDDGAALVAQAYAAQADVAVATSAGATVLVANGAAAQAGHTSEWLYIDTAQLEDGNGTLLVGGPTGNAVILVGEVGGPALHMGGLVLLNPQAGGEVFLNTDLHLSGSLVIHGSGHTTVVVADTYSNDDVLFLDDVLISGDRVLEAGRDGTGVLQLGGVLQRGLNGTNADGLNLPDRLELAAAGNISFKGVVGDVDPLEGLTIRATTGTTPYTPINVSFDSEVTVDGDLVIHASGVVEFEELVTINAGGDLRITGASHVIFRQGVVLNGTDSNGNWGDLFLEADEISLEGSEESVSGRGVLTMRPTTLSAGIEIAAPSSVTDGVLNIDADEIAALRDGFTRIVVGHQDGVHANAGAGLVRIGAVNSLDQPTVRDPLEVYGGTILVEDYSSGDFKLQVLGNITLDARTSIVVRNQIEAGDGVTLADISMYAATGSISQLDNTADAILAEPVRAAMLTVRAATGITLGHVEVDTLRATNVTSGAISITETAAGGDLVVALLSQQAASADLSLFTLAGNITVGGAGIANAGSGATVVQASGAGRSITVDEAIVSGSGLIRLTAEGAIGNAGDGTIVTGGAAAVSLTSTTGAIGQGALIATAGGALTLDAFTTLTMADGVVARSLHGSADTGSVTLKAGGAATVSVVEADGAISITAGGAILDGLTGNNANLDGETAAVLLAAASGIGTAGAGLQTRVQSLAAANTGSGGIFVREATGLRIAGSSTAFGLDAGGTGGIISVLTVDGALTVEQAVRSTGAVGHVLLQSGETVDATVAALVIRANVASTSGSISLLSDGSIALDDLGASAPVVSVAAAGQTLDLEAGTGIAMEAQASLTTAGGAARLQALGGHVVLGSVNVGSGNLSVDAAMAIFDGQSDGSLPITNLTAGTLRLSAGTGGIGGAGADLEVAAGTLAARSGAETFLLEADAVTVGSVAAVSVNRVGADGTVASVADASTLTGLQTGAQLVLRSGGALTVSQDIDAGGKLHLASATTLGIAAEVTNLAGDISLLAEQDLSMTGAGTVSSATGTVDVESFAGNVALADGSTIATDAGNIRVAADGNLTVGSIDARSDDDRANATMDDASAWGRVSLVAGGAIVDNAGETAVDIHALELRLQAGTHIAEGAEHLEIESGLLAASSGTGGMFVTGAGALTVGDVSAFTVQRIAADGVGVAGLGDGTAAGATSGGDLVLRAGAGRLALSAALDAAGDVLLDAQGVLGSVVAGADVLAGGNISIAASAQIEVVGTIEAAAEGKTVDLLAQDTIVMEQLSAITTANGTISLEAGGDITLETLSAGTAGVRISGDNILDGDVAGDTEVDITAASVQFFATGDVGRAGAALETTIGVLTAEAGSGVLFITETDGLAVGGVELNVQRVAADGGTALTANAAQESLVAGAVVLTTRDGDLTLAAGIHNPFAVLAISDNVRLEAEQGQVVVAGPVVAAWDITLLGATGISLAEGASVQSLLGTVDLQSGAGITMDADAVIATESEAIRLQAAGTVTVGQLDARSTDDRDAGTLVDQATWGTVSIVAGGAIADAPGDADTDILARAVRLQAGTAIGAATEHLELEAIQLSAEAGSAGMFLTEATAIEVATVGLATLWRVGTDGDSVAGPVDADQSGLTSAGALVLQTGDGGLLLTAAGGAVTAAGNLLLAAGGMAADLDVQSAVTNSAGHTSLGAGRDLLLGANVAATASGMTIDLLAQGDVFQSQGNSVASTNANIAIEAVTGSVTLDTVDAGTAGIRVAAVDVVDGDVAGDTEVDLTAASVQLLAAGAIGASGAQLETAATTLTARAAGDVFISDTGALAIDTLTLNVQRVDSAGAAAATSHLAQTGLAGADIVVRALGGHLETSAVATVDAAGDVLLSAETTGNLTLRAAVTAAGAVSLAAGQDLNLSSSVTTTVAGSTIDVLAAGGIVLAQGSALLALDADVQVQAGAGVTLESINAGTGSVRVVGTRVSDGDADGDTEVDIVAGALQLTATTQGVGLGNNALETRVGTLSVSAAQVVNLVESDALVLGTVATSVNRVGLAGTTTATGPVAQSNVSGTTVVVRTLAGSLQSMATGIVTGSANVLLRAGGATSDLTLGGAVRTTGGHISLDAGQDMLLNANVATSGSAKTLDLLAGRHLTQAQGFSATTNDGHAALTAGGTLTLETVSVGVGRVGLTGASIVDGDADGDTEVDVLSLGIRATATGGAIATAANALEITTGQLSLVATGDAFITETNALSLAAVSVTFTRVQNSGIDTTPATSLAQSGVSGGNIVVRTLAGALDVQASGQVAAAGNVLLSAGGATADLTLVTAGTVSSSGGHVSLVAGRDAVLGASVNATSASGTIGVFAGRDITQAQATALTGAGGNIALEATRAVTIESIQAGTGAVRVSGTSVIDGDTAVNDTEVDVQATALVLDSTGPVGLGSNALETAIAQLAATGGGNLFLTESDALAVGILTVNVQRVNAAAGSDATLHGSVAGITAGTSVVRTLAGALSNVAGAAVAATGNLLLQSGGVASDLTLGAAVSGGGHVTLVAGRDLLQDADVASTTAGNSLQLLAGDDIVQAQGVVATSNGGPLSVQAGGDLAVASLQAGSGTVRLIADAIQDVDADGDTGSDIGAVGLLLQTSGVIGSAANALETTVTTVAIDAGGAVFLNETDALVIGTSSLTLQRVGIDGATITDAAASLSGLAGDGVAVVQALAGSLTVSNVVNVAGNLLLRAGGVASDIVVGAGVTGTDGNVSFDAARDLRLNANVATAASGMTIDLLAGRDIVQAQATSVASNDGSIALQAGGDATIENLAAGTAGVWIAADDIIDGDAAGDAELDITGGTAQLWAGGAIGGSGAALETSIATLTARASGAIFVTESTGLAIASAQLNVERVASDGTTSTTTSAAQSGLDGATIVVRTLAGSLESSTDGTVTASGNLLLQALGTGADLVLRALVSGAGDVTLSAADDLQQNADVQATTSGSSLQLLAGADVTQAQGTLASSNDGVINVQAGGDATLASLAAGAGSVRVQAVNIVDADIDGDTGSDIAAAGLLLVTSGAIGGAGNALETTVDTLSAHAGGDLFLTETDALVLGQVALTVDQVGADGAATALPAFVQDGVAGAAVVLRTLGGALTADSAIVATGNLLLQTAAGHALALAADVSSDTGNISVAAGADLLLDAAITTGADGATIDLLAANAIVQAEGGAIASTNGNVALEAVAGDITLESISAGTGAVRVAAAGAIVDGDLAGDAEVDIAAGSLQLLAGGAIAASGAALETSVALLSAHAGLAIFLTESTGVDVGTLAVSVQRVDSDAATAEVAHAAQAGLDGGTIVLNAGNGAITTLGSGTVTAGGNLLLTAGGAAGDITLGAAIEVAGAASIAADGDFVLTSSLATTGTGSTIDIVVGGLIDARQGSSIAAADADILMEAGGSVTLESVSAGSGSVAVSASALIDGDSVESDGAADIVAASLQVLTVAGVGSGDNALETTVGTLSVSAGGDIFLAESNALLLDTVSTSVDRVGLDGATTATPATVQSDVSGANVVLGTVDGTLESAAGGLVTGSGNVLLVASGATSDLVLGAAVSSTGGHVQLQADRDLLQNADVTASGSGKSLVMVAGNAVTQADGVTASTNDGSVALGATNGTLTLETVNAGTGHVALSGRRIVDGDTAGDTGVDVSAGALAIQSLESVGAADNALETAVGTLAVAANGNVFLTESSALSLERVDVTVTSLYPDGTGVEGMVSGPDGMVDVVGADIVIRTLAGKLSSQATGAVRASGNLLLEAGGATSDLQVGADVASSGGHVTLVAGQDLLLGADVAAASASGTIAMFSGRDLTQAQGTQVSGAGGNIALEAGGTATIETIAAGTGAVRIAADAIVDGDTAANETEVDVVAAGLLLDVAGGVGSGTNALDTTVATLAFSGGGDLFLAETDALVVGTLTVDVQRVNADATDTATAPAAVAGIDAGVAVLRTLAGALASQAGATISATGNLLLQAAGAGSDLALGAAVSGGGHVTLLAGDDLLQNADVSAASVGSSLQLLAGDAIVQAQGVTARSNGGPLSLQAGGDVAVASLDAGSGTVRIVAAAIRDVDADGDGASDIAAGGLLLQADGAIGASGNALEITADTVSVAAGGVVFLAETDALTIGTTTLTLQRVGTDGATLTDAAASQAGVSGGSTTVVRALAGALVVTSQVTTGGNLLLGAAGAGSDIVLGAATQAAGPISLAAGRDLLLDAGVSATGSGSSIDLLAGRHIVQAQGTAIASNNGNIALQAVSGDATIEALAAGTAGVRVAAGSIIDGDVAGDGEVDIAAASAQLLATGAIGAGGANLETMVASLAAAAGGNVFVTESNGLSLTSVQLNVQRVAADGGSAATTHAALAGVSGATVVVRTVAGTLATTVAGTVTAAGNLLLHAGGAGSDLALAGATTAAGDLTLAAGRNIALTANVTTTTAGSSIDLLAVGAISAGQGRTIATQDGNILLQALGGNLTLERVDAGRGVVRIAAASVIDGDAAGDSEVDIIATQLLVRATGSVGSATNAIEGSVGTLGVAAGGVVAFTESDTLVVGTVTAAGVDRVGANGSTSLVGAATQSGITGTTVTVRTVAGALDIAADIAATGVITLDARGTVDIASDVVVRTAGDADIFVTSRQASILMDPDTSVLRSGSGDIHLTAELDIRPGALITTGFAYLDARDGRVLIQGDLQRNGEDIDIFANDVSIEEQLSSPGGTLRIGPLEAARMIIGGADPGGDEMHLSVAELALLQDGFAKIVLGSDLRGQVVDFRGTQAPLVFRDPLVVNASGVNGAVLFTGALRGDTLTVLNSGKNTTLTSATITLQRSLLLQDELVVRGLNTIVTGQGGSGPMRFTEGITGRSGTVDKLGLDANGGDIRLDKAVSIDGLTVTDARNVTFGGAVRIAGDLIIDASGTVTFKGPLTLTDGGRLIVRGGGKVVFGSTANLGSGDALLQVSALSASGGAGSLRGTGVLEVRGAKDTTPIHIGSGAPAGALRITDTALRAVGKGFEAFQVGNGAAKVSIGAADLRSTGSPVVVDARSIVVNATGSGVRVGTDLTLSSHGHVTTAGKIVASAASDLVIESDKGRIAMAAGSLISSRGGDVTLEARTGLNVANIDARGAGGSAGLVVLDSASGVITDANRDTAVDIRARGVTLIGLGPRVGAGNVLEAAAPLVRVVPPSGSVVRESGTNDRSYFNVLQGANLSQALVVVGDTARVTSDLASVRTYLSGGSASQSALSLSQRMRTEEELSFSFGQTIKRSSQVDYWSESFGL